MTCSLSLCGPKNIVYMQDVKDNGRNIFESKMNARMRGEQKDHKNHKNHSGVNQRLMKTNKQSGSSVDFALICPTLLYCGSSDWFKIRISSISSYDCNNENFNPRYCEMDCNKIDYKRDPRCLDCLGIHKDIDICINCNYLQPPVRYTKEKCCTKEIEADDSTDYEPI